MREMNKCKERVNDALWFKKRWVYAFDIRREIKVLSHEFLDQVSTLHCMLSLRTSEIFGESYGAPYPVLVNYCVRSQRCNNEYLQLTNDTCGGLRWRYYGL